MGYSSLFPLAALKSGHNGFLVQKDAELPETYEKIIFRFLFFEIWSILNSKY